MINILNLKAMNVEELHDRQRWSLNQKLYHTIEVIETFIARTGKVPFVSFSGGKDSTVLLHICRKYIDPKMKAVFINTGNEYPEIVKFVKSIDNVTIITPKKNIRQLITDRGFPLISKEVAHQIEQVKTTKSERLKQIRLYGSHPEQGIFSGKISEKWKFLIDEPFMISDVCCDILKKKPIHTYQKETGEVPILGVMAEESRLREQQYVRRGGCNSFKENKLASYPLSIWTEGDIWDYIRTYKVDICSLYNNIKCRRTGCMFCGFRAHREYPSISRFALLYETHPNLYKVFMNYTNNNVTYREALHKVGINLPDEN